MEFNEDAKQSIEKYLDEIVRNINADNIERTDMEKELRSTFYESAEAAAKSRGSDKVTLDDVNSAKAGMVSPRETAESLMMSYAGKLKKAGFWSRLVAYIIDNVAIWLTIAILASPFLLFSIPFAAIMDNSTGVNPHPFALGAFLTIMLITGILGAIVYFGYYFLLEGHFGYTIGKYLMGLRVLKTDGTKIGYKESLLRNISKYINNLIILDVLIMLIFFNNEKQRGFDKVANTMVVHVRA